MAIKTLSQLRADAQIIKAETAVGANNANRIGTMIDELLENMEALTGHLWEFVLDSQYTLGSPRAIATATRTKMTNNALLEDSHSPNLGALHIWDSTVNKVVPLKLDDYYIIRFAFTAKSVSDPNNNVDIEFDVGGTAGVIYRDTLVFEKGAGANQNFNTTLSLFVGADFFANGGEFYLTPKADIQIWEIATTITRVFTPST